MDKSVSPHRVVQHVAAFARTLATAMSACLKTAPRSILACVLFSAPAAAQDNENPHPDYFEQWKEMKGATQDFIPRMLFQQWLKADQEIIDDRPKNPPLFAVVNYHSPEHIGGRTRALRIDRSDPNHIVAGGISGGLWHSHNRGATWLPVNDQQLSLAVSAITQSPFNHKVFFYCTGEARGNSAGISGNGVYFSDDGGVTFSQLPSTAQPKFSESWCIVHSPKLPKTIFVGTEKNGIQRSDDHGVSWGDVLSGKSVTDIVCFPDGGVLASVSSDGLYYSIDGTSGTFNKLINANFPTKFQRIEVEHCSANPDVVYAAFESDQENRDTIAFLYSKDRGQSWEKRTAPKTERSMNRYTLTLAVHPADCRRVLCAGAKGQCSFDGGKTWTAMKTSHNDFHVVETFPDDDDCFITGTDGGLYRYDWDTITTSAVRINRGYHVTQYYAGDFAPSGDTVIGGTQDNGTLRTSSTAQKRVGGGDGTFCHISRTDPNLAYASGQRAAMHRSNDFATPSPHWTPLAIPAQMKSEGFKFLNPYQMNSADDAQLFCRTNRAVWRSSDEGNSWSRLTSGSIADLFAIACSPDKDPTVYLGGKNAAFLRVDAAISAPQGSEQDLGTSVPSVVTGGFIGAIEIHPSLSQTVFVGFANISAAPRIWKVSGAASTAPSWTDVSGDLPDDLPVNYIQFHPADPKNQWIAATDFGLYYTRNAGLTWDKEDRVPNVAIHQIKLRPSDQTLFVFTHGRGVWKLK